MDSKLHTYPMDLDRDLGLDSEPITHERDDMIAEQHDNDFEPQASIVRRYVLVSPVEQAEENKRSHSWFETSESSETVKVPTPTSDTVPVTEPTTPVKPTLPETAPAVDSPVEADMVDRRAPKRFGMERFSAFASKRMNSAMDTARKLLSAPFGGTEQAAGLPEAEEGEKVSYRKRIIGAVAGVTAVAGVAYAAYKWGPDAASWATSWSAPDPASLPGPETVTGAGDVMPQINADTLPMPVEIPHAVEVPLTVDMTIQDHDSIWTAATRELGFDHSHLTGDQTVKVDELKDWVVENRLDGANQRGLKAGAKFSIPREVIDEILQAKPGV